MEKLINVLISAMGNAVQAMARITEMRYPSSSNRSQTTQILIARKAGAKPIVIDSR